MDNNFLSFVKKESLHILRDRRTMLIVVLIPVMLMVLFGFAISTEVNDIKVAVVAPDRTDGVRDAVERLARNDYFTFCGYTDNRSIDALLRSGKADAVASAGHTGAAVAASKVKMRMVDGVDRPCIATIMPNVTGKWILTDAGANTDCTPLNLAQFAVMGELYAKLGLGIKNPRIGLLSVGGEDIKGNELTKETFKILSKMPINFIGNVEGHDTFTGECDVVVCDGFVGNVLLKSSESLALATIHWLKEVLMKTPMRKIGATLAQSAFRELKQYGDSDEYGGAPLLGLNGVCIIGHGSSTPKAVKNAIRVANEFARLKMPQLISERIYACGIDKASYAKKHESDLSSDDKHKTGLAH